LEGKNFPADAAWCKDCGFLDDVLFAQLYVDGMRKAVGDARLIAELVRRGIEREAAMRAVAQAAAGETERLRVAVEKLYRTRPAIGYPNAARALERLGFRTPVIYRCLRERAATEFQEFQPAEAAIP